MKHPNQWSVAALALVLASSAAGLLGCGSVESGDDPDAPFERDSSLNVEMKSKKGTGSSHLTGSQCMQCHQPKGDAPGIFTAAGTITDKTGKVMPGAIVQLTSEDTAKVAGGGTLHTQIEVDDLGNFYTTEKLPFPDPGAVPSVISPNTGKVVSMVYLSLSGACNFCHIEYVGGQTGFKDLE
jgi:hypothetical protein